MKKIFKLFLATLIIISSITIGLSNSSSSSALSQKQVKVYVKSVDKIDDYFKLTLEEDLNIKTLTYEYLTYGDPTKSVKVSYLKNHVGGIERISSGVY